MGRPAEKKQSRAAHRQGALPYYPEIGKVLHICAFIMDEGKPNEGRLALPSAISSHFTPRVEWVG